MRIRYRSTKIARKSSVCFALCSNITCIVIQLVISITSPSFRIVCFSAKFFSDEGMKNGLKMFNLSMKMFSVLRLLAITIFQLKKHLFTNVSLHFLSEH